MRKNKYYRYEGYRGRSTTTDKLKVVAGVLLVLVLLAVGGLFWGQKYIVYTDDGLRVELPFLHREEEQAPEEPIPNVEVVVEQPDPPQQPEKTGLPVVRAVELPVSAVEDGTLAEQAGELGADAVILNMKTDQGQLGFASGQALALEAGSSAQDEQVNRLLEQAADGELWLVARVSCFRDDSLGGKAAYALAGGGGSWTDGGGLRWTDPRSESVCNYLVGVVAELAQLGFDEILLDNWSYPTGDVGDLSSIRDYDLEALDQAVEQLLRRAQQAAQEYGAQVSLRAPDALADTAGEDGGQALGHLESVSGRVWAGSGSMEVLKTRLEKTEFVEIVEEFSQEDGTSQGIFTKN